MTDYSFPRKLRIRQRADFDRGYQTGIVASDEVLVVRGCRNGLAETRLGLAVSRKVGGAVIRNRWKRLIREAFRRSRERLPTGLDLIIRPRLGAVPQYAPIAGSLVRLAQKLSRRLPQATP